MNPIYQIFPNLEKLGPELLECIWATVQMVLISGFISFVFGIFFGSLLIVTKKGGILECLPVYTIIDKAIDILRSVPFIIMLFLLIPLTRIIMGTSLGIEGALVPLIFGTVPFFSRQVETAIAEVDPGLVEASEAMGLSPIEIIFSVYLRESIPGIVRVSMITLISLINLTTMAGTVGAGGVGDFAIRYGYQLHMYDMIWISVIITLIMVTIIQLIGNLILRRTIH